MWSNMDEHGPITWRMVLVCLKQPTDHRAHFVWFPQEKCGWSNGLAISLALFALCCAAIGLLFVLVYRNITRINFAPLDRDISHAATPARNPETTLLPDSEIDGLEDGEAVTPSLPASQTLHKPPNFATRSRRAYALFAYMVWQA